MDNPQFQQVKPPPVPQPPNPHPLPIPMPQVKPTVQPKLDAVQGATAGVVHQVILGNWTKQILHGLIIDEPGTTHWTYGLEIVMLQ